MHPVIPTVDTGRQLPVVAQACLPRSASSAWVGIGGVASALVAVPLLQSWLQPNWIKAATLVGIVAVVMIAADALTSRLSGQTWGLPSKPSRDIDFLRVARKLLGFWLTMGALAAAYALLPVYAASSFDPFKQAALASLPALVVIAPFYIAYVDQRQPDPNDAYAQLAALVAGVRPADWTPLRQHTLGWLVKGFFLPLMFGYITSDLSTMWSEPLIPRLDSFEAIFDKLINLFYFLDVLLAGVAYTLTLRALGTHIRSVEPTVAGWLVCLLCYPPFNNVTSQFFPYDQDNLFWGRVFAPIPALYVLWGSTILVLVAIYAWATASFGLRFSNLTNRGIITNGPYRWSKHPAYLAKNLSWWLISVPFIAGAGWQQAVQSCILLACVNAIYFLRARTEERHLQRDAEYRAYAAYIAENGLMASLLKRGARLSNRGNTSFGT